MSVNARTVSVGISGLSPLRMSSANRASGAIGTERCNSDQVVGCALCSEEIAGHTVPRAHDEHNLCDLCVCAKLVVDIHESRPIEKVRNHAP